MKTVFTASLSDVSPMTQFVVATDKPVTRSTIRDFVLQFKNQYYPSPESPILSCRDSVEEAVGYLEDEGYYWLNETWCLQVIPQTWPLVEAPPRPTNEEAYRNEPLAKALEAFNADYARVHNQMSFHDWLELPKDYTKADL